MQQKHKWNNSFWQMIAAEFTLFIVMAVISCQIQPDPIKPDFETCLKSVQDTVRLFAEGIVSTSLNERDMAISPEGDEIFYSLGNYTQKLRAMVHLRKKDGQWSAPEIMPWSGTYTDIEPSLSPSGTSLYFASTRPIHGDSTRKDYNIWVSKRVGGIWEEPLPLDTIVNSTVDEYFPSVGKSGNLYFTANHPGNFGKEDIYISVYLDEMYQTPTPLDSTINSATFEFNAFVSPGEDTLIFGAYGRDDDLGGGDLYISSKDESGRWKKARHLGPNINSSSLDYCPFIDYPRKVFYFTSNRALPVKGRIEKVSELKAEANKTQNGLDNIYFVKLNALFEK
jgi:hypothetical protein